MRLPPTAVLLLLLVPGPLGACSGEAAGGPSEGAPAADADLGSAPRREWPQGTVLAVGDLPITAQEVDAASVWVERIDRKASPEQLRRLALTNVVLPAKLACLLAPEEHDRALAEARDALERLRAGTWVGPPGPDGLLGQRVAGNFKQVGLPVWGTAMDLAEGEWSEPIDLGGQVLLVRRLGLTPQPVPLAIEVEVDLLAFPFIDPQTAPGEIEAAYDRFRLTIVDPAWRALVPELLQYRMGVHG